VVTDEPFDALSENGWQGQQRDIINGSGLSLVADQAPPLSPPNVLQFRYANGFPGGDTPGVEFYDLPRRPKKPISPSGGNRPIRGKTSCRRGPIRWRIS